MNYKKQTIEILNQIPPFLKQIFQKTLPTNPRSIVRAATALIYYYWYFILPY